ncbi:MAG TPA: DUF1735 domain-containing protein [Prolixibacteraceae bacterium]|jgi:hypothetical protein
MKNRITLIITFLAAIFLLGSCLKDDVGEYWADGVAGKMYATIVKANLQQLALQPVAGDVNYSFLVNIATDALPTEDITVTFKVDPDAVAAYNAPNIKWNAENPTKAQRTIYSTFPNVEILTKSLVIAKGTRNATASAKVWGAESLDACANFIAAISIESATTTSGVDIPVGGNMKSYLLALPIANPYAGNYEVVQAYRIRPGNATEPVAAGTIQAFNTVDCKTVKKNGFGNYSAYDISIEITSQTVVVGGVTCFKVIAIPMDASGVVVGDMFTTWTGDAALAPADKTINYYNPVTKTFVLNCYYNSAAGNRIMYEILKRK